VTPATLPQNPRLRRTSSICELMQTRQKSLEKLYLRRATVISLIHSLEIYAQTEQRARTKVVTLR